ncbi:hypothetical protein SRHO_G00157690 [Serrasalmus rhombeus]
MREVSSRFVPGSGATALSPSLLGSARRARSVASRAEAAGLRNIALTSSSSSSTVFGWLLDSRLEELAQVMP